jgi:hypothetical protein
MTRTIIVTVYGDTTKEANETFPVNLTNVTGGAVISDVPATEPAEVARGDDEPPLAAMVGAGP